MFVIVVVQINLLFDICLWSYDWNYFIRNNRNNNFYLGNSEGQMTHQINFRADVEMHETLELYF